MIQFSLVEVYINNLLETTPMNEVQCRNFKVQKCKEQEMMTIELHFQPSNCSSMIADHAVVAQSPGQIQALTYGNLITILSIDGDGIRGIIPATILTYLESQFQKLDGEDVRIVDYFDMIAGASTGGLVTAMLTAPNENNRPVFAAKYIKDFYLDNCPKIISQKRTNSSLFPQATKAIKALLGPKYDGKNLCEVVKEKLGETKLHQTLTNIYNSNFRH
ncbi:hypothetical protein ACSBR2_004252 [Camellia fascicularis]